MIRGDRYIFLVDYRKQPWLRIIRPTASNYWWVIFPTIPSNSKFLYHSLHINVVLCSMCRKKSHEEAFSIQKILYVEMSWFVLDFLFVQLASCIAVYFLRHIEYIQILPPWTRNNPIFLRNSLRRYVVSFPATSEEHERITSNQIENEKCGMHVQHLNLSREVSSSRFWSSKTDDFLRPSFFVHLLFSHRSLFIIVALQQQSTTPQTPHSTEDTDDRLPHHPSHRNTIQ